MLKLNNNLNIMLGILFIVYFNKNKKKLKKKQLNCCEKVLGGCMELQTSII